MPLIELRDVPVELFDARRRTWTSTVLPAPSPWCDLAGRAILLVMGVSAWLFLRRTADAFIFKGGRIPADAEGFVRYAQVIVSLRDRHAVEVLRVGFFQ
jgi:hypothetical protein